MESIESELLKILQDWAKKGDSVGKWIKHYYYICGRYTYEHPFMSYFGVQRVTHSQVAASVVLWSSQSHEVD